MNVGTEKRSDILIRGHFGILIKNEIMRGSRNFHERGSNENGNFWSQTRGGGGPTPKKSRNYLFF